MEGHAAGDGRKHVTIMVVDDNALVRGLVEEMLRVKGYVVLAPTDCEEALRLAEAHPGGIDLLVTDVIMPEMTGPDLARRLCGVRPQLRVLFMSGYAGGSAGELDGFVRGARLLLKPFTPEHLLSEVEAALAAPMPRATGG